MMAMAVEIIIALLVAALGIVTLTAAFIGLLAVGGLARLARCDTCGRLALATGERPLTDCPICRHERLLHPMTASHHGYAPAHSVDGR
jgi:hypothetical protein